MADEATVRRVVERLFAFVGADVELSGQIYHEDAVLEFPQSGERFEGCATFTEWRSQYPVSADDMRYRIVRTTVREDFATTELTASYDQGATWVFGVQLLDFSGDKVIRERIYVAEGWEAPEWRTPWRSATPADAPA